MFDDVPESNIFDSKNIINILITSTKSQSFINQLFSTQSEETLQNILNIKDNEGNSISYYIAVYHDVLFKKLLLSNKINSTKLCSNYKSETFLMKLIKSSKELNLIELIKWIVKHHTLSECDYYDDINSGSIITYCLKYNKDLTKLFLKPDIVKSCINISDNFEMICPYSDFAKSDILKMNVLQIACIVDKDVLGYIIKNNKKQITHLIKETLISSNINLNILHIGLFNNPESVQVLLGTNLFNNKYLQNTEEVMDGFEKVIDIQPASYYYLQQCLDTKYELKLTIDEHWYGYNYKNKLKKDTIKNSTHYILGKQETSKNNNNICNICDTYVNKVVFTKCLHKTCITCALHSEKCSNCRVSVSEKEKILI